MEEEEGRAGAAGSSHRLNKHRNSQTRQPQPPLLVVRPATLLCLPLQLLPATGLRVRPVQSP